MVLSYSAQALAEMQERVAQGENPKHFKLQLAKQITAIFYSQAVASDALMAFEKRFHAKQAPENLPETIVTINEPFILLGKLLVQAQLADSNAHAMRLIKQGAVRISGKKRTDVKYLVHKDTCTDIQVGKLNFARLIIK